MDELETIKQTGEIPVAMGCPCCKQSLAECECSMMTYDAEWLCFSHHERGEWPRGDDNHVA